MNDHSLNPENSRAWHELARHPNLIVLVDYDAAVVAPAFDGIDRALRQALDALRYSGVETGIVCPAAPSTVAAIQGHAPDVHWFAEHGRCRVVGDRWDRETTSAASWVRAHRPDVRIIAIGGATHRELHRSDVAIDHRRARSGLMLDGPSAVRAFLWWLVAARRKTTSHAPPVRSIGGEPSDEPHARLLVISRQAPFAGRRDTGGLASVLEGALRVLDAVWLGWSGADGDPEAALSIHGTQPRRATFDWDRTSREAFERFCGHALSPLFHSFPARVRYSQPGWEVYRAVNQRYAKLAQKLVVPHGTVWVHDYHLLLVGAALRERGHLGPIGLFLHAPFPPRDVFETLPAADSILEAMHHFDLIGFHADQWADNFAVCAAARSAREGTTTRCPPLSVLPMGVDAEVLSGRRSVAREGRQTILAVDRLDFAKGIPERLLAYQRLLEVHPEWRREIALVQLVVPPRAESADHLELKQQIERLVGRINGRFGEADWSPIEYLYRSYDHRTLGELYRAARVAAVTPLRDGLNLVAKEFVAAQDPADPGVLVLSRFAGAAAELTEAVLTNPYDTDGLAADLDLALRMPLDERKRRHGALAAVVAETTPHRWASAFLERLGETRLAIA